MGQVRHRISESAARPDYTASLGSNGALISGPANTGIRNATVADPTALVRLDIRHRRRR